MVLPAGFLWGCATSSHQVEGGNRNDWTAWEELPGKIRDGSVSGDAAGWWRGQAEEDLARAAALGQNAHRMSLEWSRIEPEPGSYDDDALARYREILEAGHRLGLRMVVTLHHFTLPTWAAQDGSWLSRALPERFARYAGVCAAKLGDLVDLWATINEPAVVAFNGYTEARWPPGLGDPRAGFTAIANQLRAHALAYRAMRDVDDTPVGIVLNMPLFEAARRRETADALVTRSQDWAFNGAKLRALRGGWLLPPLSVRPRRVAGLAASYDWVGLNYYGRFAVRADHRAASQLFGRHVQRPTIRTEWNDWGQPCPRGLTEQLLRLRMLGVPLYVTENGIYDNEDVLRPGFLRDHVIAVEDARHKGADVRGYFVWSLVDNFEWAEGWSTHFGLLELDRETGERRARESAEVYAEICRSGGATRPAPRAVAN